MRIALRPAAEVDIAEAMAWYDDHQAGLGDEFLIQVGILLDRIARRPSGFPKTHASFRRALLGRFPYTVYFSDEAERIVVFAVYHQRRDPRLLAKRLERN